MSLRAGSKSILNALAVLLTLPLWAPCRLEASLTSGRGQALFVFCGQTVALLPGAPGLFLRRAFYRLTLSGCSSSCHIGFGTLFTQRGASLEEGVYVGDYALIGTARLGRGSLIGSRVSILSGGQQHELDADGHWTATDRASLPLIEIGSDVWIGEGAILMADIGDGVMVSAGAVVSAPVPAGVMVAGNPARFVKRLSAPEKSADSRAQQPTTARAASSKRSLAG